MSVFSLELPALECIFFGATCPKLLEKNLSGHADSQVSYRCQLGDLLFFKWIVKLLSYFCIFCHFSPVGVDDLKRAILQADIEIDNVKMDKYIHWVFRTDKPYESEPLEQSKVIERLQNGYVSRSGRRL